MVDVFVDGPEVFETVADGVAAHGFGGGDAHGGAPGGVGGEIEDGRGPGLRGLGLDDEAGVVVVGDLGGAADVADDCGEAGGLGFHHGLAERVGGAGEDEEVARGVGGGEGEGVAEAGEVMAGAVEGGAHLGEIGAVTHDDEVGVDVASLERGVGEAPGVGEEGEVFFDADAADGEDAQAAREVGGGLVAERRGKGLEADAGAEGRDAIRADAEALDAGGEALAAGEDATEASIEGAHGEVAEAAGGIVEEAFDVGGEVGVVGAHERDTEDFGGEETDEADGAGRADVDRGGVEGAGLAEHGEGGGRGEFEVFVAGHLDGEARGEGADVGGWLAGEVGGGEDAEIAACVAGFAGHVADEAGDAVHVGEGVGEEEDAGVGLGDGHEDGGP